MRMVKAEFQESKGRKAQFVAERKERTQLPRYADDCGRVYQFSEFLSHPLGLESILNARAMQSFQNLDSNTFRSDSSPFLFWLCKAILLTLFLAFLDVMYIFINTNYYLSVVLPKWEKEVSNSTFWRNSRGIQKVGVAFEVLTVDLADLVCCSRNWIHLQKLPFLPTQYIQTKNRKRDLPGELRLLIELSKSNLWGPQCVQISLIIV